MANRLTSRSEIWKSTTTAPSTLISSSDGNNSAGNNLPQEFNVRYLGFRSADGLWGIKYCRGPVEAMINSVKCSRTSLNVMKLIICKDGCMLESIYKGKMETKFFPVDTISYGVQDSVYPRIFAMIIVKENQNFSKNENPFECHAFACDCRQVARKLTHSLAAAFQEYSKQVREKNPIKDDEKSHSGNGSKFAVDLRSPEELKNEAQQIDSEV